LLKRSCIFSERTDVAPLSGVAHFSDPGVTQTPVAPAPSLSVNEGGITAGLSGKALRFPSA
jgi:hypothetical protein